MGREREDEESCEDVDSEEGREWREWLREREFDFLSSSSLFILEAKQTFFFPCGGREGLRTSGRGRDGGREGVREEERKEDGEREREEDVQG